MKRLLTLTAMFLCCVATSFAQFSGSGAGTESDPYLILNPIHLNQMRNYLNKSEVYFKLMANIDLTEFIEDEYGTAGWLPIGTSSTPFKGVLDGNGKSISGLWINRSSTDYVGLFAHTREATIKNLTVNSSSIKGKSNVGIISGYSSHETIISGCVVSSSNDVTGFGENVGGIAGAVYLGSISDCRVVCNNITGVNFVGGVYGIWSFLGPTITNCHVQGNVNGGDYIGGICGKGRGEISNTNFCGNVTGNSIVGGICGGHDGINVYTGGSRCTINGCYAVAHVVATGNQVGGLIGHLDDSDLANCYLSGSVTGNEKVGGLVGESLVSSKIVNSYANTIVNGTKTVGGIIGIVNGTLESNVSICSSVKATVANVGRIYGERGSSYVEIGEMGTTRENKAWNKAIIVSAGVVQDITDNEQNGTGVSATTLKLKATYVGMGWDFTNKWTIQETECYPYMKSQTAPPVITSAVVSGATTISGKCVDGGTVTLEVDGVTQQMVSSGNNFSFNVSPLQAGHKVRISAKAEDKEMSYFTTETVAYLGKGTEVDPYQVYTAADLTGVYRKGYFKLMNDIDLTSYINQFSPTEGWESIGSEGSETIHFDGNGHKITGLWCNSTRDNTGLFSCFANGTIKNLTVEVAKNKQVKGGANIGILIGKMINGTIENCRVTGNLADGTPVGGLVGLFDGGTILKCQANVTINNNSSPTSYVGGLVGETTGGTINQCFTEGTLTGTGSGSYVGGLVGKNLATLTNSYSFTTITSHYNAAGVVAHNYGVVDKCYAVGNLTGYYYVAGIIGYNDGSGAIVRNCVAIATILDVPSTYGGGYPQRIIGSFKNGAPAPEMNNYALKTMKLSVNGVAQIVYDDIMNGVAKTGTELMQQTTYEELGWDFSSTWNIDEGFSFPYFEVSNGGAPVPMITADDKSRAYGEDNPELTYTVTQAELTGVPELTTTATKTSPVGTYPITVSQGTVVGNYNSTNGTLTVTAKNIATVSIGSIADQTFTGTAIEPTVTVTDGEPSIITSDDYDITYSNNTNVGEATVTLTGKGNYTGTKTVKFNIVAASGSDAVVTLAALNSYVYNGQAKTPAVTSVKKGTITIAASDYDVTYTNNTNVGEATVTVTFKNNYTGTATAKFEITAKNIADVTVDAIADQTFTGTAIEPTVTVTDGEPSIITSDDYDITYSNNTNVGEATVTLTGKGNYTGTKIVKFNVIAKPVTENDVAITGVPTTVEEGQEPDLSALSITCDGRELTQGVDYTVSVDKVNGIVTITFIGNYSGVVTVQYEIVTGIGFITADDEGVEWYTLSGLRIETPRKGTYIMRKNGVTRTVVIK